MASLPIIYSKSYSDKLGVVRRLSIVLVFRTSSTKTVWVISFTEFLDLGELTARASHSMPMSHEYFRTSYLSAEHGKPREQSGTRGEPEISRNW
jgi:hypothetical protein